MNVSQIIRFTKLLNPIPARRFILVCHQSPALYTTRWGGGGEGEGGWGHGRCGKTYNDIRSAIFGSSRSIYSCRPHERELILFLLWMCAIFQFMRVYTYGFIKTAYGVRHMDRGVKLYVDNLFFSSPLFDSPATPYPTPVVAGGQYTLLLIFIFFFFLIYFVLISFLSLSLSLSVKDTHDIKVLRHTRHVFFFFVFFIQFSDRSPPK